MATPQRAPVRQTKIVYITPSTTDILFSEMVDTTRNAVPEYGTPHPNTGKFPHHVFVLAKEASSQDSGRDGVFEFFYAAEQKNQDLYNFEVGRLRVGTLSVPMVKRTYLTLREVFNPEEPQLGSSMPNIPLNKFEEGYILHEVNQVRSGNELDSLFVREEHVYILPLTTVSRSAEDQNYVILESHVEEGDTPDTTTGVVESSVMAIGNGKAVKTTKLAITDFNEADNTYDVGFSELRGVLFDPRYGIRVEIERKRVDPDSVIGENPVEENGVVRAVSRDPESIRQSRQETRLYILPEDQVWYGSRRASNLPRVLDRIEIVNSQQNPTLIPIFEPQYDGVLPARWTRKFTFGPPDSDFSGRVYRTEEFVFLLEYDRTSESRSISSSLSVSESSGTSTSNNSGSSISNSSGTSSSSNTGSSTSNSSGTSDSTSSGSSTSDSSGTSNSTSSGSSTSASSGMSSSNSSGTSTSNNSGTSSSSNTGSSTSDSSGTSDSLNSGSSESTSDGASSSENYGNQSSNSSSGSAGTSDSYSLSDSSTNENGAPAKEGNGFAESTTEGTNSSSSSSNSSGDSYSSNVGTSTSSSSGTSTSNNSSSSTSDSSSNSTSENTGSSESNSSGSSTSVSLSTSTSNSSGSSTSDSSGSSSSNSTGNSTSNSSGVSSSISNGTSTSENTGSSDSGSSGSSTSDSSGSSTSNSLSDSSSESNSVSFGKSVLSLQIPACLRRDITVNISAIEVSINIPATVPTSLEDNQWVIEDISSNHWQDGIWVTEIVEVYLGTYY